MGGRVRAPLAAWCEQVSRVYGDRLMDEADCERLDEMLERVSRRFFEECAPEALQARRERQLATEASTAAEKIAVERRSLLADRGSTPELPVLVRAAVDARTAEGEKTLLEAKRQAAERLDLLPHRRPAAPQLASPPMPRMMAPCFFIGL